MRIKRWSGFVSEMFDSEDIKSSFELKWMDKEKREKMRLAAVKTSEPFEVNVKSLINAFSISFPFFEKVFKAYTPRDHSDLILRLYEEKSFGNDTVTFECILTVYVKGGLYVANYKIDTRGTDPTGKQEEPILLFNKSGQMGIGDYKKLEKFVTNEFLPDFNSWCSDSQKMFGWMPIDKKSLMELSSMKKN